MTGISTRMCLIRVTPQGIDISWWPTNADTIYLSPEITGTSDIVGKKQEILCQYMWMSSICTEIEGNQR